MLGQEQFNKNIVMQKEIHVFSARLLKFPFIGTRMTCLFDMLFFSMVAYNDSVDCMASMLVDSSILFTLNTALIIFSFPVT